MSQWRVCRPFLRHASVCASSSNLTFIPREMAHSTLVEEAVSCPICLDLLTDPTSIPCGHSFCMTCIQQHWNSQKRNSCPQCRKSFRRRPALVKNFMLAGLVEQLKSDVAVLQKHQLVAPSAHLQENLCPRHNRAFEVFCRTDQQLLCPLCVDQHRGHDAVSSASETALKKAQLSALRTRQLQSLQDKRSDLDRLRQEAQDVGRSALAALRSTGDVFTEMVLLLEKRRSEVEQRIYSEEQTRLRRVRELQDRLQRDVTELKKDISELDALSLIEDHNQFLLHCPPLSTQRTHTARTRTGSQLHFDKVSTAVSALRDKLKLTLEEDLTNISLSLSEEPSTSEDFTPLNISPSLSDEPNTTEDFLQYYSPITLEDFTDILLPLSDDPSTEDLIRYNISVSPPEPSRREDFLQHYSPITLDPNSVNTWLSLYDGDRGAAVMTEDQRYPEHPDRFVGWARVLSRQSLSGRCYVELQWSSSSVSVALCHRDVCRDCLLFNLLGDKEKSWELSCSNNKFSYLCDGVQTEVSGPVESRIGIFLDHGAGTLSFYSVCENMRLIHRVHSTFTQPLFVRLQLSHFNTGDTAHFPQLS